SSIRYGKGGVEVDLLYSSRFQFRQRSGWYDLLLGYRHYQGFPSDQIRSSGAIGYIFSSYIQTIATLELDYVGFNGKAEKNLNNIVFHPNYRLLTGKLEAVIRLFSPFSVSLGGYQHLWGQNVGAGGGFFCGLWTDF